MNLPNWKIYVCKRYLQHFVIRYNSVHRIVLLINSQTLTKIYRPMGFENWNSRPAPHRLRDADMMKWHLIVKHHIFNE